MLLNGSQQLKMKHKASPIVVPEGTEKLLLHACCAPCSSAIVEWMLANGLKPTIYYFNPNIFPIEEYIIRKEESKRHADSLGVEWIDGDYNHEQWVSCVQGMENEPERGLRCEKCFELRLQKAAEYAKSIGAEFFTTSIVISPHKNFQKISRRVANRE